jgi:hypothetical protein
MAREYKNSKDFYKRNPDKAQEKSDKNNSGKGGEHAHTDAYKRKHYHARKSLGLKKGDKRDASKQKNGLYIARNRKLNRGKDRYA